MTEKKVIERIRELMENRHWSVYRLAKEAAVPYSTLNNVFNRGTCPSIPVLLSICDAYGITLPEFFEGLFSVRKRKKGDAEGAVSLELSQDEADLMYLYRALSRSDKKIASAYMQGLGKKI